MNILIISSKEKSKTIDIVSRHKYVPIIRRSLLSAIEIIKHHRMFAIIIDNSAEDFDVLEFVLNLNDLGVNIPIYISKNDISDTNFQKVKEVYKNIDVLTFTKLENSINSLSNRKKMKI